MQLNDGERLKLVRKVVGNKSQQNLAKSLDIPIHKIRDTEAGKIKLSIDTALKIEEKYDFDFKWLLTGEGDPQPAKEAKSTLNSIDGELLQAIIVSIEEGLNEKDLQLEPEKKAELITLLYDHFAEAEKKVDQKTVRRYLRLVA